MSRSILFVLASSLVLAVTGEPVSAQAPDRSLSVMSGSFSYDYGGDASFPMGALRLDRRISKRLLAEVGVSWALGTVDIVDHTVPEPTVSEGRSSLGAATVGIQAELPLGVVRPYLGIAAGLFSRVDHPARGDRFVRPTMAFPVGVRVPLGDKLIARTEARLRFDEHQDGSSAFDSELLIGFGWKF